VRKTTRGVTTFPCNELVSLSARTVGSRSLRGRRPRSSCQLGEEWRGKKGSARGGRGNEGQNAQAQDPLVDDGVSSEGRIVDECVESVGKDGSGLLGGSLSEMRRNKDATRMSAQCRSTRKRAENTHLDSLGVLEIGLDNVDALETGDGL
jgi:hypothetical protein